MTAQEYIESELEKLAEPVHHEDIGSKPIEQAIYEKVMSKKFRKLKVDEDTEKIVKKAIAYAVKNNKPVKVGSLFGGNKLWRLDEAPEIDWGEIFNVLYSLKWMKTIASVYEPGAYFEYYSQDISVESLNNIPHEQTDKYSEGFRKMLEWLKPKLPKGVQTGYERHGDLYKNRADYLKDIEEAKKIVLKKNNSELPKLDDTQKAATELNVKLKPGQDDDPHWREKVELEHQAIFENKTLVPYLTDETIIPTCPTPYPGLIATGSTKKSIAKFWAGVGALEKSKDSFNQIILTPRQLKNNQFDWEDVRIEGLTGKNFKRVRVLQ